MTNYRVVVIRTANSPSTTRNTDIDMDSVHKETEEVVAIAKKGLDSKHD